MSQHHNQSGAELFRRELYAADLRRCDDVARHANDEQVSQTLIEDDFHRHSRIRTSENGRERLLTSGELDATRSARERVMTPDIRHEPTIPIAQQGKRL